MQALEVRDAWEYAVLWQSHIGARCAPGVNHSYILNESVAQPPMALYF